MSSPRPSPSASGFSIVEVVLALGIAAFALVAVVGLLPLGLGMAEESQDESGAVNIVSTLIADRLATSSTAVSQVYYLPAMTASAGTVSGTFGVKANGEYTGTDLAQAHYRVSYSMTPASTGSLGPWTVWFRLTWPAQAVKTPASFETVATFPQP